jgi:CubicO group peptidase (beta-lactamase class C family)
MALVVLCLGVACAAGRAQSASEDAADFQKLEQRLEALRVRWRVPGMSAAVARDGAVLWARGFGEANVAAHRRATPDTVYHLASLTKPFAAMVLLQLVQEGRLSLDAPVSDYGIELKSQGVIRVRHLLTHTFEEIPGETYRYNGTRFGALDKVLTGVTGNSFATEVGQRILEPLGLTNTCPNPHSRASCVEARRDAVAFQRRLAQGYDAATLGPVDYKRHFVTAAGLVSTVGDMVRFSAAVDDGRLLGPEMHRLMFTPASTSSGKTHPYGIGWFVQNRRGTQLVWHYGWWVGDSALMIKVPERKLSFVLLANSDGLSRKFDLGKDNNVRRSPFARAFLDAYGL